MTPQQCGLDSLAAGAAFFDQGHSCETLDKSEILLLLVQNLFLKAQGLDDIPEPVVIRQNNDFNIFPLIRQFLKDDYRVNAEKFWGIVKKAYNEDDVSKEIWRPRFQGSQLKCLGTVRYPRTAEEWERLHAALAAMSPALVPLVNPDQVASRIKSFVHDFGQIWRSERRFKYKRQREVDPVTAVDQRLPDDELQSVPRPGHGPTRGQLLPEAAPLLDNTNQQQIDHNIRITEAEQFLSQSGEPSQTDSQTLDKGKVIATLVVGGKEFTTTIGTLNSVSGSFFSKLIRFSDGASEFFVDRSPLMFDFILDYLRAVRYAEPTECFPLPDGIHELKLLRRESIFYKIPELTFLVEDKIDKMKIPNIDIVVIETASVPSEQALNEELHMLSNKAAAWMQAKAESLGTLCEKLEVVSQDIRVIDTGPSTKKARVALTMQNHHV